MRRLSTSLIAAPLLVGLLASCGEDELILPGERLDLRAPLDAPLDATAEDQSGLSRDVPISLPPVTVNANWTHKNGNAQHRLAHPALNRNLSQIWSVEIGEGNGRKHRITADPVIADGRVYTLDSRAGVRAHSTGGDLLWSRDLTPAGDRPDDASGGGIAVSGGTVFVTTGFGEVTALEAASGATLWTQDLESAATGAPTAEAGVVYLVTRNSIGWAIDATNGRILWQVLGAPSDTGIAGGPAPALTDQLAIFPFGSGQMVAAAKAPGTSVWTATVAGQRLGRAFSRIEDLTGDPVVAGDTVYAGNHSGRVAAFDLASGRALWTAEAGAMSPIWLAGGSVFLVSDENRLMRLDAATGETVWENDLPLFDKERISRRKTVFAHYGPVLAGGRLLVASDDGTLHQYDPASGDPVAVMQLPGGAARNPVVAGGTLYIVTENGQLHAFR